VARRPEEISDGLGRALGLILGLRIHRHVTCITSGAQSLPYRCHVAARLARQMFRTESDLALAKNGVMEPRVSMAVKERRGRRQ
jgi:hypothetical protein